ncbi:MAG: 3-phosphoshikimate 1-carboxyvinyltransferase [Planctomycetia bacterium]|nr:3-phosphoshikimate 1-carboxyvinyltransferase [Planctomycetia bacterium]
MASSIEIQPVTAPLDASIRPPGSKSLTNRALVCAALAEGTSQLRGALDSEDTRVMIEALRSLGITIVENRDQRIIRVTGCGGKIPSTSADLYIANSGTTVRFLTALVSLGHGTYRLHGTPRMHERPIKDLLDVLKRLGVRAESETNSGCPPVLVHADGLRLDNVSIRGDVSSQFLSAMLLVAPCATGARDAATVKIEIVGGLVSKPYVAMTVAVMRAFEAEVTSAADLAAFEIELRGYHACDYQIEPDASAASYFWAAAAIAGGRVRVEGLNEHSLQGDTSFCKCLEQMGCQVIYDDDAITVVGKPLRGIDVDMNAISDTVQTLAAVAVFADSPTQIRGVGHIRHKETDRISALATELGKLGAEVEERPDGLRIVPRRLHGARIDTYNDHRMAMSMALPGLKVPGVIVDDPGCTAKTYPRFFDDLERLRCR